MMQSIISKLVRLEYGPPLGDEFKTHQAYVYDSFGNSLDYQMISSGFATARLRDRVQLPGQHQGELIDLQKISQNAASGCLWKDFIVPTLAPTLVPTEDPDAILEMTATVAAAQTAEAQPPTATPGPTAEPLPTTTPVPTPVPRISLSLGSTPFGFANGSTQLSGAKVIFDGDVGVISVQVRWEPGKPFFSVTVVQATGEIVAGNVYQSVGLYVVTVKASTDEGDTATATINALVN
jgi:hypothetical protein